MTIAVDTAVNENCCCFQSIDNFQSYVSADPSTATSEKEHVLVALKISIAGRNGILLLDPGYHVARVITVMADLIYPHTGEYPAVPRHPDRCGRLTSDILPQVGSRSRTSRTCGRSTRTRTRTTPTT